MIPNIRAVALLVAVLFLPAPALSANSTGQKAVLVTGASSGIGRNIAQRLAREGYFVYAGARSNRDIAALSAIDNIQGVRLDVTIPADIDAAVEIVRTGNRGLHGIVNNAGVVVLGILAETDKSELDFVFDVNVYGPYRIVKAFAPLLVESNGRIVNISSMAGISSPQGYGIYGMSKHAVEAFSRSLALEMATVGVQVSVIEPGPFKSNAIASYCQRSREQDRRVDGSLFPDLARELATLCKGGIDFPFPEPDVVADAVLHALSASEPEYRYLAVADRQFAEALMRDVARTLVELSRNGHAFSFSREQIVGMVDAVMAERSQVE